VPAPPATQGFNRYAYVRNNPLRYTDPSGFCYQTAPGAGGESQCIEEIDVRATRQVSEWSWLIGFQSLADMGWRGLGDLYASSFGRQVGDPAGPAEPSIEEVVTTATRLSTPIVAAPVFRQLPWELAAARSLQMWSASAVIAGLLAMPAATSETSDLVDENGEPRFVYHFTNETGKRGISASRLLMPGASGLVYFSNLPYPTAEQAQRALSLPRTPSGFYAIPRQNVPGALAWGPVEPNYGQPGGGLEASFPGTVPLDGAQWFPVKP